MLWVRSSRRVAGLKPADYDHEIDLINHDEPELPRRAASASAAGEPQQGQGPGPHAGSGEEPPTARDAPPPQEESGGVARGPARPAIEVQAPTPDGFNQGSRRVMPKRPREVRQTAIDILYENERGGFLCGTALFSSKALGSLDPPAWTNAYHKASPTSIHTAQVPDPSWEWLWPEWRINIQDGVDDDGWEYSFAFSKKFSWHNAKWWNSFVRRRAWIRKRAMKRHQQDMSADPHMLNTDYFVIRPASYHSRLSNGSLGSSRAPSKSSMAHVSMSEVDEAPPDIEDMESLLRTLRSARIDREKREAVENYLDHATDLSALQAEMHEIMSLFVFQASRRQLLSHLMRQHDRTLQELAVKANKGNPALLERKAALDAAIKHAGEEVRRLAYWSDVKQMAESGELRDSADPEQRWFDANQGLDSSGPAEPNKGKLPA
ncbi:hypothetical protein CDD83_10816 [Cordyceps sp. RAO-2017]|nr:hypothetical protein CDD83_10816 [Cordyceps sp. RAO-2017]